MNSSDQIIEDFGEIRAADVHEAARGLGFARLGLVPLEPAARAPAAYRDWLAAGRHGDMAYLATAEHVDARADPRRLLASARTLVVVALSTAHPAAPVPLRLGPRGRIARYARGADYHLVLKAKLEELAARLAAARAAPLAARACVDTAPLLERDAAERAGLGFVAKNTMLIVPGLGSHVLLGELLLGAALAPDAGAPAHQPAPQPTDDRRRCGSCRACLDACPTGAFVDAYALDARRCISYLTIELAGPIPRELRPLVGAHVFGCDVCQDVCPFNAADRPTGAPELAPLDAERAAPPLADLLALGQNQYRRFVKRTALRRLHLEQLLRNACVAAGNSGDATLLPPLSALLAHRHPLVRGHAAWALGRLGERDALAARRAVETDAAVLEELDAALAALAGPAPAPAAPPLPATS